MKQSVGIELEMAQGRDVTDKDFKAIIVNLCRKISSKI